MLREPQQLLVCAGSDPNTFAGILGSNLLVEFDARFGFSAGSWTDRRRALALSNLLGGSITLASDGAHFNGLPVVQSSVGSPAGVLGTAAAPAPPIYLSGARPYALAVTRMRDLLSNVYCLRLVDAPISQGHLALLILGTDATTIINGANLAVGPWPDTNVHVWEYWLGADNLIAIARDGVQLGTVAGTPLVGDSGKLSIGGNITGSNPSNSSHALHLICDHVPPPEQRAQLLALAQKTWNIPAKTPPLPASAVEYWHSEIQCSTATWTGQIRGINIVPYIGAPPVGVDTGFFNGRQVYKTVRNVSAGSTGVAAITPPLTTPGTYPWLMVVARTSTFPPAASGTIIASFGQASDSSPTLSFGNIDGQGAGTFTVLGNLYNQAGSNLAPHSWKVWPDGSLVHFAIDGTEVTMPGVGPTTRAVDRVVAGLAWNLASYLGDASIAFMMLCSSKPTAAEEAALDTWAKAYWGIPDQRPPLPASAVEYWHSELQCTPTAWVGQVRGSSLAGVNTPVVGVDSGFFNNRNVARCATSPSFSNWVNRSLPVLVADGSRPWIMVVARQPVVDAASKQTVSYGSATQTNTIGHYSSNAVAVFNGVNITPGPAGDTAVHTHKMWLDGTNANYKRDGAAYTLPLTAAMVGDMTAIGIGDAAHISAQQSAAIVAFYLICSSKPTAAEEAALDAWAQAYWGTP